MNYEIREVDRFWKKNLCGSHFINEPKNTKKFFEKYRKLRYKKEFHLNTFVHWKNAKDKILLEIGTGIGADATRWAEHAKYYIGIDLTEESVLASRLHFQFLNLRGNFLRANSELLPFRSKKFDMVYSHGVLHHTPNIEKALREIHRILKPKGEIILMLYTKDSLNYWLRIQIYFRVRFFLELFKYKIGIRLIEPWKSHINNFRKYGWIYFSWKNWHHHCTDGPGCPISNIYNASEIRNLLKNNGFHIKSMRKAHLPIGIFNKKIQSFLAKYFGFYQFIWAEKIF